MFLYEQMKDEGMLLGAKIKELRERKDWTQGQLALYSRLGRGYLSQLETERIKNPSADTFIKLAKALDVDENELYEAAGLKKPGKPPEAVKQFQIWLLGKAPTPEELEVLRELGETIFKRRSGRT